MEISKGKLKALYTHAEGMIELYDNKYLNMKTKHLADALVFENESYYWRGRRDAYYLMIHGKDPMFEWST